MYNTGKDLPRVSETARGRMKRRTLAMTKSKKMLASILTAAMILTASAPVTYAAAPATRTSASSAAYVKSDTTMDFTVTQDQTYQFRFEIVGPRGLQPNLVAGNGSVLQTEDVKQVVENGHDVYYFKVRAIGKPGQASAIYTTLPGQKSVKHCTIAVGAPYVKSDTTVDFAIKKNNTYQFRFEIVGPRGLQPNLVAGNGSVLQTEDVKKVVENGHDVYYFKVRAIGKSGEGSSIYTTLPGQASVKHCTIWVDTKPGSTTPGGSTNPGGTSQPGGNQGGDTEKPGETTPGQDDEKPDTQVALQSISLNQTSVTLEAGNQDKLTVSYNPSNTTESKDVTWTSSNSSVATVDASGIVTAKAAGGATITAKVGTKTASCIVTVKAKEAETTQPGAVTAYTEKRILTPGVNAEIEFNVTDQKDVPTFQVSAGLQITGDAKVTKSGNVTTYEVPVIAQKGGNMTLTAKTSINTATVAIEAEPLSINSNPTMTMRNVDKGTVKFSVNAHVDVEPSVTAQNATVTTTKTSSTTNDIWTVTVTPKAGATSASVTFSLAGSSATTNITITNPAQEIANQFLSYAKSNGYNVTYNPSIAAPQLIGYTTSKIDMTGGKADTNSLYNLLEKMKSHEATEFAVTVAPDNSGKATYFTYKVVKVLDQGTNPNPDWDSIYYSKDNTDFISDYGDGLGFGKDEIGCNPYAVRRLEEVTGINIGDIDVGTTNNQVTWNFIHSYYLNNGFSWNSKPEKNSIQFSLEKNASGELVVSHVAFIEETWGEKSVYITEGNANPSFLGYHERSDVTQEDPMTWYLYTAK